MNDAYCDAVTFIDDWLHYKMQHCDIPGLSIAISSDDKIIFKRSYGYANIHSREPLTTEHLFSVASQTKMITALAVMTLVEKGTITLEDELVAYLPWLTKHRDRRILHVTVLHLLSHTSGLLRDGQDSDYWLLLRNAPTEKQLIKIILDSSLAFTPGQNVKYSNLGYALLGLLTETITGLPFSTYVSREIIAPLRINSLHAAYSTDISSQIAPAYSSIQTAKTRSVFAKRQPLHTFTSAAGSFATPEAMCKYVSVFFTDNTAVVKPALKVLMRQNHSAVKDGYDAGMRFGLGFEKVIINGRELLGHTGHAVGHVSATFFDPKNRLVVSVASNARDTPTAQIAHGIFEVLDFYMETEKYLTPGWRDEFTIRAHNNIATVHIIQRGNYIVAIDPSEWQPFQWREMLKQTGERTLQIITQGSVFNYGEPVEYIYWQNRLSMIRFAGLSLFPEDNNYF